MLALQSLRWLPCHRVNLYNGSKKRDSWVPGDNRQTLQTMATSSSRSAAAEILARLTSAQQEAVSHVDGPLLILAGPGSGKTRVVTHRIAYLLAQGISAQQIVALTFTNKAAEEMQLRLQMLAPQQPVWIGTFHRFCARLLRQYAQLVGLQENFSIYDSEDSRKLLTTTIRDSNLELVHVTPDQIGKEISAAKNGLMTPESYRPRPSDPLGAIVAEAYPAYQRRMLAANAVDFDDLLLHVGTLLQENPELRSALDARFRYIAVDEYQDTNFAQYAIVRALSQDYSNLAATGDPDQSIYGWRGATMDNILDFEKDYPKVHVVRLEQNYRSTPNILRAADGLIRFNTRRKEKDLFTDNPPGQPVRLITYPTCGDEAEHIAAQIADEISHGRRRPRDFAIFYRVNSLSRRLESALRGVNVPYQIIRGLEFYQRKEIKDVIAYLHLINNPASDVAFLRIINTPPRRIGKTTVSHIADHAKRYQLPLLEAAREAGLIESLGKRAAVQVAGFVAMVDRLRLLAAAPLQEIVGRVLQESGYREWLSTTEQEEGEIDRIANVDELLNEAGEFDGRYEGDAPLESYLQEVCLANDIDGWESETDRVSLMTLHAAKGLEFPVVFIVAVEQNFLPHTRSQEDPDMVEEERRLLFVGITRAEQELQLSLASYRNWQGSRRMSMPSPFLIELPRDEMEVQGPPRGASLAPRGGHFELPPDDDSEWDQSVEADDYWVEDSLASPPPTATGKTGLHVVTATDLLNNTPPRTPVDPAVFQSNMVVQHPEFGLGKITSVSGEGAKRSANVAFFSSDREKTFVLAFSELRPVKSGAQ